MTIPIPSSDAPPVLPVYCKTGEDGPWPGDRTFYLLTRDGPFLCRHTRFFDSSAEAPAWDRDLAGHQRSVVLRYPPIPQRLFERVVGFFDRVAAGRNAEAVVLLIYHDRRGYEVMVPPQTSVVDELVPHDPLPIRVRYEIPSPPPDTWLVGSIHSHPGHLEAFTSYQDAADVKHHFPGLHFVVGGLDGEPPGLHGIFAVDGTITGICDPMARFEGYDRRREDEVPEAWFGRVAVEVVSLDKRGRRRQTP